jgi:glucokinase
VYARQAGIPFKDAPAPKEIEAIAYGTLAGDQEAAVEAYRRLGEIIGDAIANALTLIDGLAVIGGGLAKAHPLFLPALIKEMEGFYLGPKGCQIRRLIPKVFDLEDVGQLRAFLGGDTREIAVPGSHRKIKYDPLQRTGIGLSRLGTSEAIAIGAYAFALNKLS